MEKYFLLKPYGIDVTPTGEVRRTGWLAGTDPEVRVFLDGGSGTLVAGKDDKILAEQSIGNVLAEALLRACGENTVAVSESDTGRWRVLQYQGRHWGVVIGIADSNGQIPDPPFGWKVVREVTGEPCASERSLAFMSEEEAARCRGGR